MSRHPARMPQARGRSRQRNSRRSPGVPSEAPFEQVQLHGQLRKPARHWRIGNITLASGSEMMPASPPTGYLEIERALRLLALGDSDIWIASKLHGVDHPAATRAAML